MWQGPGAPGRERIPLQARIVPESGGFRYGTPAGGRRIADVCRVTRVSARAAGEGDDMRAGDAEITDGVERRIPGWCALCRSRCGCISVVREGRLVAVERNPDHPTGRALCAKGQSAPDLVYSPDRLLHPLKRTRPKGDPDPGWTRIGWDEALDLAASNLRRLVAAGGPESVAFAITTPSGTSISDSLPWVERLLRAFGTPNNVYGTEICNWHKDHATRYTFGTGIGTPDLDHAGCVLLWGHNPTGSWLAQGQRVNEARARGARLVVVDPRRAGVAAKADEWLRVRPGTDGALALGIAGVMIEEGWFDRAFLRDWSNGPFLVLDDTVGSGGSGPHGTGDRGRLLTAADLAAGGGPGHPVAWRSGDAAPEVVDPGAPAGPGRGWALEGSFRIETAAGPASCRTAFSRYRDLCREFPPDRVEQITGVPAGQVRDTARLLWESRPVAYYAWSGVGQHTNATQTDRAISLLYALTGSHGGRGGNVTFSAVPANDISGAEFPAPPAPTLGIDERPLGPPRSGWCTSRDFYRAVLDHDPYPVRGLVTFGSNLLVSHASTARGVEALERLDFYVHSDLFLNPTAQYADLVLPVNTAWEREALRVGFEITQEANAHVQLRPPAVEAQGESRSDGWIAFALAERLGFGDRFWGGDMDAGYREWLAPSGISLEELRASPEGVRWAGLATAYEPYKAHGGFATPSRRVEVWSETFRRHGQDPLPGYVPPAVSAARRPDLADRYPLVLSSAKPHQYCHGQHRNLPKLRKLLPDPQVEVHPDTAAARGIADGDWVGIRTPSGQIRARARFRDSLAPDMVATQHGWWQHCEALGLPGYPAHGDGSANVNLLIDDAESDPISGSAPHRSYLCEIEPLRADPTL